MKRKSQSPKPLPKDAFPITFEHALRLVCGGRDVPDRFALFRRFWRSNLFRLSLISGSGVVVDNTDEAIKYFRDVGVDYGWFNLLRVGIYDLKEAEKSAARREAVMARWRREGADTKPGPPQGGKQLQTVGLKNTHPGKGYPFTKSKNATKPQSN